MASNENKTVETMSEKELRELDAWIAEHVFNYVWARDTAWIRSDFPRGSMFRKGTKCLVEKVCKELSWSKLTGGEAFAPDRYHHVPHYSTNAAAAMMVLEKCLSKVRDLTMAEYEDLESFNGYRVYGRSGEAIAETLPLAICLFAKKLFCKEGK